MLPLHSGSPSQIYIFKKLSMLRTKSSLQKQSGLLTSVPHDMVMNPQTAWEYIHLLTGGTTVHHKKKVIMAMKMENGKLAASGKENMSVCGPHFSCVYNNHCPADPSILEDAPQFSALLDIDSTIMCDEVNAAINKPQNGKSLGLNGILPEAFKAMNGRIIYST